MKHFLGHILAIIAILLGIGFTGCTTVDETGRSQMKMISDQEVASMAVGQFEQMKQEMPLSNNAGQKARLQRVGEKIVVAARERGADLPPADQWEFVLFESDQINAFAMPGGKVGFYTGIFPLFQSDDDLAVVMGHEIAHVSADHGAEKVSHQLSQQLGGALLAIGLGVGGVEADTTQIVMASYGVASTYGGVLPYSRTMEAEADEIGLIYSSAAGYDPRASVGFWQRMASQGGARPPEFLSTHPSEDTRISNLENNIIPQVMPIYQQAKAAGR